MSLLAFSIGESRNSGINGFEAEVRRRQWRLAGLARNPERAADLRHGLAVEKLGDKPQAAP